ncbi:hypothetical protein ABT112_11760 [Streptomyces sp. NPDC002055]|uniref:hypothetical protein n=1 Tax=Streptomyces sp. NPDC002055 TaxID=3154534 RepID=UPI00332DB412
MPMPGRRLPAQRAATLLTLCCALLVSAGCSSGTAGPDRREPEVTGIPSVLASTKLRMPLESYLPSREELRETDRARVVLIDRCMERFGFDYTVQPPEREYGPRSLTERRYGISEAKLAAENGYGLGDRDPSRQPPPARPKVGPAAETVLFGKGRSTVRGKSVPEGGCAGRAEREFTAPSSAGASSALDLPQRLSMESFNRSRLDSRVKKASRAWSECMTERGYDYPDPLAPLADPQLRGDGNTEAVATATADIRCKKRTNLIGIWFAVESAYQRELIRKNSGALQIVRRANGERLRMARAVTTGVSRAGPR